MPSVRPGQGQNERMDAGPRELAVPRGQYRLHAELTPGSGTPVVLMHGLPDNLHLYDRLLPHLAGRRPVVRFDFLGWGRSDKPRGYPYTADNQTGDLDAALTAAAEHLGAAGQPGAARWVLVAHDASGPPAIDWALAHPERVAALVLLNTYYRWTPPLRRPPAIALYSTPLLRSAARALALRWPELDRRLYLWQVGRFVASDAQVRRSTAHRLYRDFVAARPAFWRLNDDLLGTVARRRGRVADMRRFAPPVRVVFGARDRYLNPRVARRFAGDFPHADLHLLGGAGHYVQVDRPERVADLILTAEQSG